VVFDTMGGQTLTDSWGTLKPGGILVSIVEHPDSALASAKGLRAAYVFVSPNGEQLRDLAALIEAGKVKAPTIEILPLAEAAAALEKSRTHHVRGKIALKIAQ
jgi:NADPH2:quinone reductase